MKVSTRSCDKLILTERVFKIEKKKKAGPKSRSRNNDEKILQELASCQVNLDSLPKGTPKWVVIDPKGPTIKKKKEFEKYKHLIVKFNRINGDKVCSCLKCGKPVPETFISTLIRHIKTQHEDSKEKDTPGPKYIETQHKENKGKFKPGPKSMTKAIKHEIGQDGGEHLNPEVKNVEDLQEKSKQIGLVTKSQQLSIQTEENNVIGDTPKLGSKPLLDIKPKIKQESRSNLFNMAYENTFVKNTSTNFPIVPFEPEPVVLDIIDLSDDEIEKFDKPGQNGVEKGDKPSQNEVEQVDKPGQNDIREVNKPGQNEVEQVDKPGQNDEPGQYELEQDDKPDQNDVKVVNKPGQNGNKVKICTGTRNEQDLNTQLTQTEKSMKTCVDNQKIDTGYSKEVFNEKPMEESYKKSTKHKAGPKSKKKTSTLEPIPIQIDSRHQTVNENISKDTNSSKIIAIPDKVEDGKIMKSISGTFEQNESDKTPGKVDAMTVKYKPGPRSKRKPIKENSLSSQIAQNMVNNEDSKIVMSTSQQIQKVVSENEDNPSNVNTEKLTTTLSITCEPPENSGVMVLVQPKIETTVIEETVPKKLTFKSKKLKSLFSNHIKSEPKALFSNQEKSETRGIKAISSFDKKQLVPQPVLVKLEPRSFDFTETSVEPKMIKNDVKVTYSDSKPYPIVIKVEPEIEQTDIPMIEFSNENQNIGPQIENKDKQSVEIIQDYIEEKINNKIINNDKIKDIDTSIEANIISDYDDVVPLNQNLDQTTSPNDRRLDEDTSSIAMSDKCGELGKQENKVKSENVESVLFPSDMENWETEGEIDPATGEYIVNTYRSEGDVDSDNGKLNEETYVDEGDIDPETGEFIGQLNETGKEIDPRSGNFFNQISGIDEDRKILSPLSPQYTGETEIEIDPETGEFVDRISGFIEETETNINTSHESVLSPEYPEKEIDPETGEFVDKISGIIEESQELSASSPEYSDSEKEIDPETGEFVDKISGIMEETESSINTNHESVLSPEYPEKEIDPETGEFVDKISGIIEESKELSAPSPKYPDSEKEIDPETGEFVDKISEIVEDRAINSNASQEKGEFIDQTLWTQKEMDSETSEFTNKISSIVEESDIYDAQEIGTTSTEHFGNYRIVQNQVTQSVSHNKAVSHNEAVSHNKGDRSPSEQSKRPYKCPVCSGGVKTVQLLQNHLSKMHLWNRLMGMPILKQRVFICPQQGCSFSHRFRQEVASHLATTHDIVFIITKQLFPQFKITDDLIALDKGSTFNIKEALQFDDLKRKSDLLENNSKKMKMDGFDYRAGRKIVLPAQENSVANINDAQLTATILPQIRNSKDNKVPSDILSFRHPAVEKKNQNQRKGLFEYSSNEELRYQQIINVPENITSFESYFQKAPRTSVIKQKYGKFGE